MEENKRSARKVKTGTVISNKMQNTVVVNVDRTMQHHKYGKVISRRKKYYAHDSSGELKVGDTVLIAESRPISKLKRWRVVEKVTA